MVWVRGVFCLRVGWISRDEASGVSWWAPFEPTQVQRIKERKEMIVIYTHTLNLLYRSFMVQLLPCTLMGTAN